MLTLLDALSVAGDRAAQNDDAWGLSGDRVFVLDGATDLYETPLMDAASDAGWIAQFAASRLAASERGLEARDLVRRTITQARAAFEAGLAARGHAWPGRDRLPITTLLMVRETQAGVELADMGDSRIFWRDASGASGAGGGNLKFKDDEAENAKRLAGAPTGGNARYRTADGLAFLREQRALAGVAYFPFGVEPHAADHVRVREIALARPAHLLLATDGFAALSDTYEAYDPAGLVAAAVERGLAPLAEELRAIERGDSAGERHPRWKRSDDATAVLLRLEQPAI